MPLNKLWHVFTYNVWFPYRYSFCLTFFMMMISYKSFLNIKNLELKKVWKIFFILVGCYFIIEKLKYPYLSSEVIYCTILMLFAVCIAIKLIKSEDKNIAFILLAFVMCVESFINTSVYMKCFKYGDRNEFYANRTSLTKRIEEVKESDNGFYRIENNLTSDYNVAMGMNYFGIKVQRMLIKD